MANDERPEESDSSAKETGNSSAKETENSKETENQEAESQEERAVTPKARKSLLGARSAPLRFGSKVSDTLYRHPTAFVIALLVFIATAVWTLPRNDSSSPQSVPVETRLENAVAAHQSGNIEEAKQVYLQVLREDPGNPVANFNLGLAHQQQNNLQEAEVHYRRSLEGQPEHARAMFNLAILLESAGRYEDALDMYTQLLEAHPDTAAARINMGFLLVNRLDRRADGIEEFERALELDPSLISRIPDELVPPESS